MLAGSFAGLYLDNFPVEPRNGAAYSGLVTLASINHQGKSP